MVKVTQLLIKLMGLLLATVCSGASAYNASYNDGDEVSETQSDIHLRQLTALYPSFNGLEGDYDNSSHTGAGGTAASPKRFCN